MENRQNRKFPSFKYGKSLSASDLKTQEIALSGVKLKKIPGEIYPIAPSLALTNIGKQSHFFLNLHLINVLAFVFHSKYKIFFNEVAFTSHAGTLSLFPLIFLHLFSVVSKQ